MWKMQCSEGPADVEAQVEKPSASKGAFAAPRVCGRRWCCLGLGTVGAAVLLTATALLWPRDVTWRLTALDVLDESSLMYFVASFGQPSNETLPMLTFHAGAAVENPNFLGGRAQTGNFEVLFQGETLGSGTSKPVEVPARGEGEVQADVKVQLDPVLLKKLTDDVLQNSLRTTVTVKGAARVHSIFGLQLTCRMECEIRASVTEIFGETKQAVVESKNCSYAYF